MPFFPPCEKTVEPRFNWTLEWSSPDPRVPFPPPKDPPPREVPPFGKSPLLIEDPAKAPTEVLTGE